MNRIKMLEKHNLSCARLTGVLGMVVGDSQCDFSTKQFCFDSLSILRN